MKVSMYWTKYPPSSDIRVVLCHFVLVEFVDLEYEVAVLYSDPHFIHDPCAGQNYLLVRLVTASLLKLRLGSRPT
jgi:hypothetical protein